MPTFKWTFAGEDKGAAKLMKDFATAAKEAQAATDQAATKISSDLDRITERAQKANESGQSLKGSLSGGLGQTLGQGLESAVSSRSTLAGNVLSQFGGGESLLAGISTGTAVATAGLAVAGAAAVKFGVDSVKAFTESAKAVDDFQDKAGGTAQQASVFVGASQQLGVSTDSLSNAIFNMSKNVNANQASLEKYGATVVRTKSGGVDTVATFESIAQAYARLPDQASKAELATKAFGKTGKDIIDVLERGGPVLDSFFASASQHAPIFSDQDLQNAVDFKQKMTELNQEWEKLKVNAGKQLVPVATDTASGLEQVGQKAGDAKGALDSFFGAIEDHAGPAEGALSAVGGAVKQVGTEAVLGPVAGVGYAIGQLKPKADTAGQGMKALHDATGLYYDALPQAISGTNSLGGAFVGAGIDAQSFASSLAQAHASFVDATGDIRAHASVTSNYAASLDQLDQLNQKMTTSSTAVADAQASGAKQIADAQKGVQDALSGVADAQASYAKAVDDANRSIAQSEQDYSKAVDDANRKVTDAEEQASKRIVDAQQKVTDARHRAAEAAESSARRVEDAQQALLDAETNALRDANPYDAQRKREDAGKALTRAQEDAAQQQSDSADTVARAEQDLADTQTQAAKDRAAAERDAADQISQAQQRIADAHRQAAEQIQAAGKQVEDAEGRVADASARVQQTSDDAQAAIDKAGAQAVTSAPSHQQLAGALQGVADNAYDAAYQMKLAGASDQDIQAFLDASKQKIDDYAGAWGFTAGEVAEYNRQVSLIQRSINVQYNMSLNASQFYGQINAAASAMHVTGDQLLADANSLGITPVLKHDTGGYLPVGLSLSINKTGRPERVLTPAEMDAGGGGGTTIIVQGSVISDRDLADIIAKAQRRGYKGF